MSDRIPFRVKPMLATLTSAPFHRTRWVYEEKYDGYRILAYKEGARVTLLSRNDKDRTQSFASIASAVAKLPARTLLLDGEVVAFDRHGVSRFQLLQRSASAAHYAVFDCLYQNGRDLRREPLAARRPALEKALGNTAKNATIFVSARLAANGLKAYEAAKRKGLEGLLAKDESAPYQSGRSNCWLKVKVRQEDEFIIVGYTAPGGSREHFGALLLGAHDRGRLRYVGKVGTGFTRETLARLFRKFRPLIRTNPAVIDPPREKDVTYLAPKLIAEIAYGEFTHDGKLRQPAFLGLRDDKPAREVTVPEAK
jgi:bifunctional non-homologous end joining protein LigD